MRSGGRHNDTWDYTGAGCDCVCHDDLPAGYDPSPCNRGGDVGCAPLHCPGRHDRERCPSDTAAKARTMS